MAKQGSVLFSWFLRPYSLVVTISLLFILIFGTGYFVWQQHYNGDLNNQLNSDKITANLLSSLLSEHQRATIAILQAYANRPTFIKAVKKKDPKLILPRLIKLKESNEKIDIVFVADTKGFLWVAYPLENVPINKNFSYRDWFKGVSKKRKPYVSSIYKRLIGNQELAVATCVPVFDEKGQLIGILANPQSVSFLSTIIRQVPFGDYTKVTLVDQAGYIIYSNKFPLMTEEILYPNFEVVQNANGEQKDLIEMNNINEKRGKSYATLAPMKDIGWTVIIERRKSDILEANYGHIALIASFSLLLFISFSLFVFYIRESFLLSKTEKLLEMEKNLREKDEIYRTFINSTSDIVFLKDEELKHIIVNDALLNFFGMKAEDVIGKTDFELQPDIVAKSCRQTDKKALEYGTILVSEELIGNKMYETRKFPVRLTKDKVGVGGYVRDVTERKLIEEALKASEEKYRSIFDNAVEGIFQTTPEGRYISANPSLVGMFGYDSPGELIKTVADLSKQGYVNSEDRAIFKNTLEKQGFILGFETQHYRKDGSKIWISINARVVKDEANNVLYYEGTVEDITKRKEAEDKLSHSVENLRKAMGATIQLIAQVAESKDPYTAGHQKRVSNLARAIASEMNLPSNVTDGIRMAGAIHDIGKISVPAEILSKPGVLSNIEFSLIKTHVQTGYDILKDVVFPWPIATIVFQHHERIDGSGYPQGLKGGQILIEARIISVADVVEAIATHRPYREGLGMDAALDEIEKNRGVLYDGEVVNVCLKLFREKGFVLE